MRNRALILLIGMMAVPAFAAKVKDPKCKDVNQVSERLTPEYLAVVDGYNKAGKEVGEVDFGGVITESENVKKECAKNANTKLVKIRKHFGNQIRPGAQKVVVSPTKEKCQEFLTLDDRIKPIVAYWVAGHSKTGEVNDGEVEDVYLSKPIASLIEDCKATPTASFYDKAKIWVKKQTQ